MNDEINRYLGVLTFPFVDIHMLNNDVLQKYLDKNSFDVEDKAIIRQELIKYMSSNYVISDYDELYLMLDKWYTYPTSDNNGEHIRTSYEKIFYYLHLLSKSLISQRDGKIVYKYWENEADEEILGGFSGSNKIYFFHSINRMFPLDILSIIYFLDHGKEIHNLHGYYGGVEVSDALLNTVLQKGVAENHLHKGVSRSFLSKWNELMQPVVAKDIEILKAEVKNSIEESYYLHLASRIRMDISLFIRNYKDQDDFWRESWSAKQVRLLKKKIEDTKYISDGQNENLVDDLLNEILEYWNQVLSKCGDYESDEPRIIQNVYGINLITSDENIFLYKTLEFVYTIKCKADANNSKLLHEIYEIVTFCFLNYLRIKNYFYNRVVQQKGIHGLIYFQKFYGKNSSFGIRNGGYTYSYWTNAIREQLQNKNMKKLELRFSLPQEKKSKICLKNFFMAYRDILRMDYCVAKKNEKGETEYIAKQELPRVALVNHLTKKEQNYAPEKCVAYQDMSYMQYGELYRQYQKTIDNVKQLRLIHGIDKYIVGIDVASLENAVPTWVFSGIYENARDGKCEPMTQEGDSFQSLGFTMHAGEDFRHVLSGIRRIYEAIQGLKFHAGDRIGHGIALGISPEDWYKTNQTVVLPRIEALENYLWAYMMLEKETKDHIEVNLSYLEKIIYKLASEIYGDKHVFTIHTLEKAYEKLYYTSNIMEYIKEINCTSCDHNLPGINCNLVKQDGDRKYSLYHETKVANVWNVDELLSTIHCKYYAHKMNEPIHMKVTQQDIDIAVEVQKLVREFVNERGILIEVNPSSNLVISEMDNVSENQIYGINHCKYDFENILTCINSDDPSVFNTNVANEIGYIYFGMIEKGVSREAVLQWIEKLRSTGMNGSFIKNNISDQMLLTELDRIINSL